MEKLQKIFPLSFKFCRDVKSLVISMLLHIVLNKVAIMVYGAVVDAILTSLLMPACIVVVAVAFLGITVMSALSLNGGTIFGLILIVVAVLIYVLLLGISAIVSLINKIVSLLVSMYAVSGTALSVINYARLEDKNSK